MIHKNVIRIFCFILFSSFSSILQSSIGWSTPATISSANFNASDPQIVIDSQGNTTVAWVENNLISASTLLYGGSWSVPISLSNALNIASNPNLAFDSTGNIIALWVENGVIESSTLPFGANWSAETSPISSSGASYPCLAVSSNGNAVSVWVRGGFIETATRVSGVWGSVTTLSSANSDFPQVGISANGTVVAVWHSVISGLDAIMSATKTFGGNWNSAQNIFTPVSGLHHNYPKVAIDMSGNTIVAWFCYSLTGSTYQNVSVLTSSLTFNANQWTISTLLSNPGIRNPSDLMLKVAFDPIGNAIAFWTNSYEGQLFSIESAAYSFGGLWGHSVMPHGPSIYTLASDIAVNSSSCILTTYMNWDGSLLKIQSQESNIASPQPNVWIPENPISHGSNNGYPRCALTYNGNISYAVVVWINFNGSKQVIQSSVGSRTEVLPPTNLSISQNMNNFGVYKEFFNTITWHASLTPNIQQYNIFRNGVFFTATDPSTLQLIDHNATQNGAVTYGVAAQVIDINYTQSTITSISFP